MDGEGHARGLRPRAEARAAEGDIRGVPRTQPVRIASWFNHRPELEPGWLLEADEIARLNAAYTCIAWILCGDGESYIYVYFDRDGVFGFFRAHQDELDEVYTKHLLPMQSRSPADRSLSRIVIDHLRGVRRALESLETEG